MINTLYIITIIFIFSILPAEPAQQQNPFVLILGIAQDAGFPHAGCTRQCCDAAWKNPLLKRMVTSIAIIDPISEERWIVDVTPDFPKQLHLLDQLYPVTKNPSTPTHKPSNITGIFLTHAHIGHYTGLMYFGRESMNAKNVPVFAMPRMRQFLRANAPWEQLVKLHNIELVPILDSITIKLNSRISITPFIVAHRDEYSETIGLLIKGVTKSLLYIPDINKWDGFETSIEELIALVSYAYLDGTFYSPNELPGARLKEVPHPFITDSLNRFMSLPLKEKHKIRFIHFNHTNPLLNPESAERKQVLSNGYGIAEQNEKSDL